MRTIIAVYDCEQLEDAVVMAALDNDARSGPDRDAVTVDRTSQATAIRNKHNLRG